MNGVKRGLFSNEAGSGSAPCAAAAAECDNPVRAGLTQALGVFIDTIIICSCTAMIMLIAPEKIIEGKSWYGFAAVHHAVSSGQIRSYLYCTDLISVQLFHISWNIVLCQKQCGIFIWR